MNTKLMIMFNELADYEQKVGRKFPSLSFRKVAGIVSSLKFEIKSTSELVDVKGIGDSAMEVIEEYLASGKSARHLQAREALGRVPVKSVHKKDDSFYPVSAKESVVMDLCKIPGIGEVTAGKLYDYGFRSRDMFVDRMKGVPEGEVIGSSGVTLTKNMKVGMEFMAHTEATRMTVAEHDTIANPIIEAIKGKFKSIMVSWAGSRRRGKDTIGDVDIIIGYDGSHKDVLEFSKTLLQNVLMDGDKKVSGIVNRRQVDFRIVRKDQWGSMLLHATGSAEFNKMMRLKAIDMNLKLSEYGVRNRDTDEVLASKTEQEIFDVLGMKYVAPEDRSM